MISLNSSEPDLVSNCVTFAAKAIPERNVAETINYVALQPATNVHEIVRLLT